jgi:group I intron endonuclease
VESFLPVTHSGIYQIRNIKTDQAYVGSSCDLWRRLRFHYSSLDKGTHPNPYLQHAYKKYGAEKFRPQILEENVSKADLLDREQYWMDLVLAEEGKLYNLNLQARNGTGHTVSAASRGVISRKLRQLGIKPPSRVGIGYGFCKLYCPAGHYKTSKALIHGSNSCKECQRLKSRKWRAEH